MNIHQLPKSILESWDINTIQHWIKFNPESHNVQICDCCGNGEVWYGEPGEHFQDGDHGGPNGPYAYNGGLPECY